MQIKVSSKRLSALFLLLFALLSFSAAAQTGKGNKGSGSSGNSSSSGSKGKPADAGANGQAGETASAEAASSSRKKDLRDWLKGGKLGPAFTANSEEIAATLDAALDAGVPIGIIKARIAEAATKGVSLGQSLDAFRKDAEDLIWLAGLGKDALWPPSEAAEAFYGEAAAAMRNGVGSVALKVVFQMASVSHIDSARAAAALVTVSSIRKKYPCSDEEAAVLTAAIAASKLSPKKIPSLSSLAAKFQAEGMPFEEFSTRTCQALRDGASLPVLEKALRQK